MEDLSVARPQVRLSGELICASRAELAIVEEHLAQHIALTRAERGCLAFEVRQSDDPFVWRVEELFTDEDAFARHQERASCSAWGRATSSIQRRYEVTLVHAGVTPPRVAASRSLAIPKGGGGLS